MDGVKVEILSPDSALIEQPAIERIADLEVGDTADLEICVTKSAMRNLLRVAQTSESAVSQVSKPAWLEYVGKIAEFFHSL